MGSLAALPCPLGRGWVGNMESSVSSLHTANQTEVFGPLLRARGRKVPLLELNTVGSLCGYLRQRNTEGESEGFPGRDKDRRDGMESRGHRKTQRGTGTWEPERKGALTGRM